MMDLGRTVVLVDGKSDLEAFKKKFFTELSRAPAFRQVRLNGRNVTPAAYAKKAHAIIRLCLNDRFCNVVCIVDREGRPQSADDFAGEVRREIEALLGEHQPQCFEVVAADRMLENWILADVEGLKACADLVDPEAVQQEFEGVSGASRLRDILTKPYNKVIHAARLFAHIRLDRARRNSPSLDRAARLFCSC